jgi:3'-phosphoadenosine 5'-phosphosulfate sulfotransferase
MERSDKEYSDKVNIKHTIKKEVTFSNITEIVEPIKKGRPRKVINGDFITESVRKAIPLREIARMCNCSRDRIYFRYGAFVKKGRELANQDWREEFNRRMNL